MKKNITTVVFVVIGLSLFAQTQIPNGGFENWKNEAFEDTFYEAPSPWDPGSICAKLTGGTGKCAVAGYKVDDAYSGDYAMKVLGDSTFGFTALFDHAADGVRPNAIKFMAKTSLVTGDSMVVTAIMSKGSVFDDIEIGRVEAVVTQSHDVYTAFSENINWMSDDAFDMVTLFVQVKQLDNSTGSSTIIDDLAFEFGGITSLSSADRKSLIKSNILMNDLEFNYSIESFEILNTKGERVLRGTKKTTNVSALSSGIYILRSVNTQGEMVTERVFKQ